MKELKATSEAKLQKDMTDLIVELLKNFVHVIRQPKDPAFLTWFFDERPYQKLASSIVQMLGTSAPEERDVIHLIAMTIVELEADDDGIRQIDAGVVNRILERLRSPQEFQFYVPISAACSLPLGLDIGGPHQLKIDNPTTEEYPRIKLSGQVKAIHAYHASRQIEADVKSLIGSSIAMGIAEPLPAAPIYDTPVIRFSNTPIDRVPLDPTVGGLASRIRFVVPNDLDELENRRLGSSDSTAALEPRLRGLRSVLSSKKERAKELRTAAGLLFDAFAASEGMAIALAFMSMEAVLLDHKSKESIVARLSEAVAYRLGKSADNRRQLRKQVSNLYEARSSFVHTGTVNKPSTSVSDARDMSASVLRSEILDFDPEAGT